MGFIAATRYLHNILIFKRFLIRRSVTVTLLLCAWPAWAATATRDDHEIQRWLHQHAQRTQSAELPAMRHRVVGDLDGDGREDVAVLYTLKLRAARRGESRYLAVFKRQRASDKGRRDAPAPGLVYGAHVLVSGPGAGEANRATILNRAVVVEMLTFKPGDARCCPTQATTRRYKLVAGGLTLERGGAAAGAGAGSKAAR